MSAPRLDLSKVRHDLRTPINHILGYCEVLLEEENIPEAMGADLGKIRGAGWELIRLVNSYFGDENWESPHDPQLVQHELRTPVNHIIGYSELLAELAIDLGCDRLVPDLDRIHRAGVQWLALMEEQLIPDDVGTAEGQAESVSLLRTRFVAPGISLQTARPQRAHSTIQWDAHILVVDDDATNRDVLMRRLLRCGGKITSVESGVEALHRLRREPVDLVLLDLLMPGLDGYQVLAKMKADSKLRHIPVIIISGLDQENGIARCLEVGAEDYLTKPFNSVFLRARIGASLEKKRWRDQEQKTFLALQATQKHLAAELAEAGAYVESLLPKPLTGNVRSRWAFKPSMQLGGDAFGYHWLDPDNLAIYLLDVCGHGVGAALVSISALNSIRSGSVPGVDFHLPQQVLHGLNRAFAMEQQNQMYFTLWYGVFNKQKWELTYATAGHPPALLFSKTDSGYTRGQHLKISGPPIGSFPEAIFRAASVNVQPGARLLVFSDGVYEILLPDGKTQTLTQFGDFTCVAIEDPNFSPDFVLASMQTLAGAHGLEDDFSLVDLEFS